MIEYPFDEAPRPEDDIDDELIEDEDDDGDEPSKKKKKTWNHLNSFSLSFPNYCVKHFCCDEREREKLK